MDGRVKTLHPKVHGGLLAVRDNPEHVAAMEAHGIGAIDLVVVNLYPFEATVARGASRDEIIENIDIGGPSMVRSAAKNHEFVAIVTDPNDYAELVEQIERQGGTDLALRRKLAAKAYALTGAYDSAIASWFAFVDQGEAYPGTRFVVGKKAQELRYGENPHQKAALYLPMGPSTPGVAQARQVQGKELSYNNLNDANAALELVAEFRDGPPTAVIVKHANPCGVASGDHLLDAWKEALACDSVSAFGGIVAVNRPLDGATAEAICGIFTEVVVAPDADEAAIATFARKKNLRLLLTGGLPDPARGGQTVAVIAGGLLFQDRDNGILTRDMLKVVTKRTPTEQEIEGLPVRLDGGQARQVQRHRLRQGRRDGWDRRWPDEPPRFGADRGDQGAGKRPKPTAGPSRARSVRLWRQTPFSPSPTDCWPPSKPERPR